MKDKILFILLLAISILTSAKAENSNLVGAWQGPKDLMLNICALPEDRLGICSCGIFRTFGWVDVALTIDGDSLMIKAKDDGSPLVGRFRIESAERLTGTLTMGYPGEDWYFSGPTEFIKQKPVLARKKLTPNKSQNGKKTNPRQADFRMWSRRNHRDNQQEHSAAPFQEGYDGRIDSLNFFIEHGGCRRKNH